MANETVSVIVPVYNIAADLPRCVESVLHQTYPHWELLLVDDGSTDESGSICDDYARRDQRVKVIHKPNGGVSAARNTGIAAATGAYLAFLDSDDYVEPELYEKLAVVMQEHQLDMAAFGLFVNDTPAQAFAREEVTEISIAEAVRNVVADGSENLFIGAVWNKLYRRSTMLAHLHFDPSIIMAEDMLVTVQCLTAAQKIGQLTWSGYHYVQRETSMVHTYKKNKCSSAIAHEKMAQLLEKPYPDLVPQVRQRNLWHCYVLLMEQIRGDRYYPEDVALLRKEAARCSTELKNADMSPKAKLQLRLLMTLPGLAKLLHLGFRLKQ